MPRLARISWLAAMLVLCAARPAHATWSIVAVDPATGEVGGASATCTPWAQAIFEVVPGKGVIVTQAASNRWARYRGKVLLIEGQGPAAIIADITDRDFDPRRAIQQHGVAALGFRPDAAGYTGAETGRAAGDLQAAGVSVQGNILAGRGVLTAALRAFEAARADPSLTLADRLLLALQAGADLGGDRRCGAQTATSAYLVVARPDDPPLAPSVRLAAPVQEIGGRNAVELLREMYERTVGR